MQNPLNRQELCQHLGIPDGYNRMVSYEDRSFIIKGLCKMIYAGHERWNHIVKVLDMLLTTLEKNQTSGFRLADVIIYHMMSFDHTILNEAIKYSENAGFNIRDYKQPRYIRMK